MALMNHLPRWVRRLLRSGSHALALHDAIEARFTEVEADLALAAADTTIGTASDEGLERWGEELNEQRMTGETREQYALRLKAIKQGQAVNEEGLRFALDKWGLAYQMLEFGDASTFWDRGFYDREAISVPARQLVITFGDPFLGKTPTPTQIADAKQRANNAIRDVNRVRARGVKVIAVLPMSLQ
ncbi:hypothetical protein J7643_19165 [bacterium]|nr:hypothetical protein [bacterium]